MNLRFLRLRSRGECERDFERRFLSLRDSLERDLDFFLCFFLCRDEDGERERERRDGRSTDEGVIVLEKLKIRRALIYVNIEYDLKDFQTTPH
jgi:hypothetical protein